MKRVTFNGLGKLGIAPSHSVPIGSSKKDMLNSVIVIITTASVTGAMGHGKWENIVWHIDHNSVGDSGNISLRLSLVVPCAGTGEWEILWHGNQMGNCGFTSVGMTFIHTCGQCLSKVSQYNLMIILANSRSNYDGPRPTCRQLYSKTCINISSNVAN